MGRSEGARERAKNEGGERKVIELVVSNIWPGYDSATELIVQSLSVDMSSNPSTAPVESD